MALQSITNARILIVDDEEKYLATMRRILQGHFDVTLTKDPVQALKIFEYQGPYAVVVSDYRMPFLSGIELFSRIYNLDKNVQRIMLTAHAELQMTIDAINHGKITAFLTKPAPPVTIRTIIADAVRIYNDRIDKENYTTSCTQEYPLITANGPLAPLTTKEKEILSLLAKGFTNEEISSELTITVGTVKSHLTNLYGKMDVNSRSKVVAKGIELGLIKTS